MSFDWLAFLDHNHVDYVERGPNVAKGEVGVSCPFCRDDPSHHLAISLSGRGWYCRRERAHKGQAPWRLIQALIGCSREEAFRRQGAASQAGVPASADFQERIRRLLFGGAEAVVPTLTFPEEIKPLDGTVSARRFLDYLITRGFSHTGALRLAETYGLRYATRGPYKLRIVIPIVTDLGLVSWTGRAIVHSSVRYKTLSERENDIGLPRALEPAGAVLFNQAELFESHGKRLVLVEGPFDALKLDFYLRDHGVRATCSFGKNISDEQIDVLSVMGQHFEERWLVQDPDASMAAIATRKRLAFLKFRAVQLPSRWEDPGAMNEDDARRFFV